MNDNKLPAARIIDVSHSYQSGKNTRQVLTNLSVTVEPAEIFGILGPNGGGKTTLFKILSTSLTLQTGAVEIFGTDLKSSPAQIRKQIGVVFQNPSLDKKLTLLENILTQGILYGLSGKSLRDRAQYLLQKLALLDRADDYVEHLSGGLARRGEIAKGLLHQPALLLLDEPSTGLDPGARKDLWDLLFDLRKDGVTIMVTTHLMEEGDKCDRVGILHQGRLIALGTPDNLKKKIGGDIVIIQAKDPKILSEKIWESFQIKPLLIDQTLRIEIQEGHKFIPKLVEAFPGHIRSISVGQPTLEDVFVQETGRPLEPYLV